ncbi:MAG TPA: transglutaminase family protein [Bryobacteraceae bacterium]|jgi:transglutaminase-like putative cysteine protease
MSFLTVRHVTVYRYREPVGLGEHRMLFRPRESHDLRLIRTNLVITPQPLALRWLHDPFDNSVAVATFEGTTTELRFESTVTLEHFETTMPEYPLEDYARTYPFRYSDEDLPTLLRALAPRYASETVSKWALECLDPAPATATVTILRHMSRSIREQFTYMRRVEKGVQSPEETLSKRRGSCRDFALLMMEACRTLGIAARFVSGYIFVPDSSGLAGGGATHAWMQAYLPGAGWIDFDPTNSIVGNRNLIRVAVAWDPDHLLPLWGTYDGAPEAFAGMDVTVRVTEAAE